MAPSVTTILTVARTGSRVVRYLIRPAHKGPGDVNRLGHDPWLAPELATGRPDALRRQATQLARRGMGLGKLTLQGVLGAVVIFPLLLIFGVLFALGIDPAGWLLGMTLLLGLLGLVRTAVRATRLINAPDEETPPQPQTAAALPASLQADEAGLLGTLRTHERALPPASRVAFHAAVIATRDALRASADDAMLDRDTFDVRQAARQDIPELLATFRTAAPTPANQTELQRQLGLIEGRMAAVARDREAQKGRALKAHGRYLENKYREKPEAE